MAQSDTWWTVPQNVIPDENYMVLNSLSSRENPINTKYDVYWLEMYSCVKAKGSSDNLFDHHLIRPQNIDPVARTQDHLAEISAQLH